MWIYNCTLICHCVSNSRHSQQCCTLTTHHTSTNCQFLVTQLVKLIVWAGCCWWCDVMWDVRVQRCWLWWLLCRDSDTLVNQRLIADFETEFSVFDLLRGPIVTLTLGDCLRHRTNSTFPPLILKYWMKGLTSPSSLYVTKWQTWKEGFVSLIREVINLTNYFKKLDIRSKKKKRKHGRENFHKTTEVKRTHIPLVFSICTPLTSNHCDHE